MSCFAWISITSDETHETLPVFNTAQETWLLNPAEVEKLDNLESYCTKFSRMVLPSPDSLSITHLLDTVKDET